MDRYTVGYVHVVYAQGSIGYNGLDICYGKSVLLAYSGPYAMACNFFLLYCITLFNAKVSSKNSIQSSICLFFRIISESESIGNVYNSMALSCIHWASTMGDIFLAYAQNIKKKACEQSLTHRLSNRVPIWTMPSGICVKKQRLGLAVYWRCQVAAYLLPPHYHQGRTQVLSEESLM